MNTKHVPSLELCQEFDRLCKEKGIVVPHTEYWWCDWGHKTPTEYRIFSGSIRTGEPITRIAPAPLVSELGEWLPCFVEKNNRVYWLEGSKDWNSTKGDNTEWTYSACTDDFKPGHTLEYKIATTEANARQKMLNYLIAEGIITTL